MDRIDRLTEDDETDANVMKESDDVGAAVDDVVDDICDQVGSEELSYPDINALNRGPDLPVLPFADCQVIDIEQGSDSSLFDSLCKQDTVVLKNGKNSNREMDSEHEKAPLSYELEQGNRILREIMSEANKSVNWAFMEAVDADKMGLYDYYERIKKPMWLKKSKLPIMSILFCFLSKYS